MIVLNYDEMNLVNEKRRCRKCGTTKNIEEHHIIPREWGGEDTHGRICLCKKHHTGPGGIHEKLNQMGETVTVRVPRRALVLLHRDIKALTEWWLEYG